MSIREHVGVLIALLLAVVSGVAAAGGAHSQRARQLRERIKAYQELAKQRAAEKARYRKQFEAAFAKKVGVGPSYPGMPNGWDNFSICPDVNDDPGSAMVHYLSQMNRVDEFSRYEDAELAKLRKELAKPESRPGEDGDPGSAQGGDGEILEHVKPIKVTASTRITDNLGGQTATTVIAFTFWNVGSLAPGYGKVSGTTVTTFGGGGKESERCSGTFAGGPDGSMSVDCGGARWRLQMNGGRTLTVIGEAGKLTVDNPKAFDHWPEDLGGSRG